MIIGDFNIDAGEIKEGDNVPTIDKNMHPGTEVGLNNRLNYLITQ